MEVLGFPVVGPTESRSPSQEVTMKRPHKNHDGSKGRLFLSAFAFAALLNCSAPQPRLTGVAYEYDSAKDMLKKGRFDKALEFSEAPAKASPPQRLYAARPGFPGRGLQRTHPRI